MTSCLQELAWYENPSWERHVMIQDMSGLVNMAAHDIDARPSGSFPHFSPALYGFGAWFWATAGDPTAISKSIIRTTFFFIIHSLGWNKQDLVKTVRWLSLPVALHGTLRSPIHADSAARPFCEQRRRRAQPALVSDLSFLARFAPRPCTNAEQILAKHVSRMETSWSPEGRPVVYVQADPRPGTSAPHDDGRRRRAGEVGAASAPAAGGGDLARVWDLPLAYARGSGGDLARVCRLPLAYARGSRGRFGAGS